MERIKDPESASYVAPQVTPAAPNPWTVEGHNPAARTHDAGGYGATILGLASQVGTGSDTTPKPVGSPFAEPAPGGAGEEFWGRSVHAGE